MQRAITSCGNPKSPLLDGDGIVRLGIYKNGEMTPTGADSTAISDGEHYELILGTW